MCLRCWLPRSFGEPRVTRRPWRLQCLDLSRNSLSDDSVCQVMDCLKNLDVRIERLWLAGNCCREKGLMAITEYIWNCPDALLEVDFTDNEVVADPKVGPTPGSDVVSAFLRCFYNHGAYPLTLDKGRDGLKVLPMLLRMGGNFVASPEKLLKLIRNKGGRQHVKVCPSEEPYPHTGQEYLAVCLPDFLEQRPIPAVGATESNGHSGHAAGLAAPAPAVGGSDDMGLEKKSGKRRRSASAGREHKKRRRDRQTGDVVVPRSRRRDRSSVDVCVAAAAPALDGERVQLASGDAPASVPAAAAEGHPPLPAESDRWRQTLNQGGSRSHSSSSAASSRGVGGTGRGWRQGSSSLGGSPAKPLGIVEGQVIAQAAPKTLSTLIEEDQKHLQQQVDDHLKTIGGLPTDQSTREMLAEFVVCMVVAKKGMQEVEDELDTFLGKHTKPFLEWFQKHMQEHFGGFGLQ